MSNFKFGVAWNDSMKLGNEQVDNQHYQLFEMLSDLVGSCLDGSDITNLRKTLNFLVSYTVRHFVDEEALQVKYNFPDYKRHRQLHEDFKVTVGELVQRFEDSGSTENLSNDVNKIIVRWLINHINGEDKKIGAHIREVESGEGDE